MHTTTILYGKWVEVKPTVLKGRPNETAQPAAKPHVVKPRVINPTQALPAAQKVNSDAGNKAWDSSDSSYGPWRTENPTVRRAAPYKVSVPAVKDSQSGSSSWNNNEWKAPADWNATGFKDKGDDTKPKVIKEQVFVGGLPHSATEGDVSQHFQKYGHISEVKMKQGYCFVRYAKEQSVKSVLEHYHYHKIHEKWVECRTCGQFGLPEGAPIMKDRVFVGGLRKETVTQESLKQYFIVYGGIKEIELKPDRGFAFIVFNSSSSVHLALHDYDIHSLDGKWVEVRPVVDTNAIQGGGDKGASGPKGASKGTGKVAPGTLKPEATRNANSKGEPSVAASVNTVLKKLVLKRDIKVPDAKGPTAKDTTGASQFVARTTSAPSKAAAVAGNRGWTGAKTSSSGAAKEVGSATKAATQVGAAPQRPQTPRTVPPRVVQGAGTHAAPAVASAVRPPVPRSTSTPGAIGDSSWKSQHQVRATLRRRHR